MHILESCSKDTALQDSHLRSYHGKRCSDCSSYFGRLGTGYGRSKQCCIHMGSSIQVGRSFLDRTADRSIVEHIVDRTAVRSILGCRVPGFGMAVSTRIVGKLDGRSCSHRRNCNPWQGSSSFVGNIRPGVGILWGSRLAGFQQLQKKHTLALNNSNGSDGFDITGYLSMYLFIWYIQIKENGNFPC